MNGIFSDIVRALSPVEFCRSIGFEPDPWQRDVLESRHPRILLNAARQTGKSWVSAAKAVHVAVFEPGSLVLVVAPSLRQSQELYLKTHHRPQHGRRRAGDPSPPACGPSPTAGGWRACRARSRPSARSRVSGSFCSMRRPASRTRLSPRGPFLAVSGGQIMALPTPPAPRGLVRDVGER